MDTIKFATSVKVSDIFNGKTVDGIYFKKDIKPETNVYKYHFIHLGDGHKYEHNEELDMDRWLVVLFESELENEKEVWNIVYFQTYLGDPLTFVKNQISSGSQGIVIKKSLSGFQIILDMLKSLKVTLIDDQLKFDKGAFEFQYT